MIGTSIGRPVFVGLDTRLTDQFPEWVRIEDDVTLSFPGMPGAHDDAHRMDCTTPAAGHRTAAPGVAVGERAVAGAAGIVTRAVPAGRTVACVPSRVVQEVS